MKKSLLFISALVAGATATSVVAQTIPNAGFENWTGAAPDEPTGWGTANATKGTAVGDFKTGASAIILTTKDGGGTIYPGVAATGTVTTNGVKGGIPWTSRPVSLDGFAKYVVPTSLLDTAIVGVIFTKWNSSATPPKRDTIGTGSIEITTGYSTFGAISAGITFTNSGNPDTCQIILASSDATGTVGSMLYIDDLSFTMPAPPVVLACTPDSNIPTTGTAPTILPLVADTIIKTPGATFNQTFTIYVPSNFDFAPPGAPGGLTVQGTMDSVHIDGVAGIPSTFTVTCGTPNCMVYGGQVGCFTVVGPMPNVDDTLYQFDVTISPYGVITGPAPILSFLPSTKIEDNITNQALASYTVKVGNPVIIGIESFDVNGFNVSQNSPNPFDVSTVINFNCPVSGKVGFVVTDVLGRQVYDTHINATAGSNTFTFTTDLSSGTYFFSVSDGNNTITRKMIVTE